MREHQTYEAEAAAMDATVEGQKQDLKEFRRLVGKLMISGPEQFSIVDMAKLKELLGRLA